MWLAASPDIHRVIIAKEIKPSVVAFIFVIFNAADVAQALEGRQS